MHALTLLGFTSWECGPLRFDQHPFHIHHVTFVGHVLRICHLAGWLAYCTSAFDDLAESKCRKRSCPAVWCASGSWGWVVQHAIVDALSLVGMLMWPCRVCLRASWLVLDKKGLVFFNTTCNIQVSDGEANEESLDWQQIFRSFGIPFQVCLSRLNCTFGFAGHGQLWDLGPPGFLRKILQRSK